MRVEGRPSKPELSTWLGTGTFYLAPTVCGLVAAAAANAFGTAVATNQWQPMLEELKRLISLFGG
jgi:hypothetical protein